MKRILVVLLIICQMLFSCAQKPVSDLDATFIGDPREAVILILGKPNQEKYANLLGVPVITLIWRKSNTTFRVDFDAGRVVYKERVKLAGLFNDFSN